VNHRRRKQPSRKRRMVLPQNYRGRI
jgi:hypothetical protein